MDAALAKVVAVRSQPKGAGSDMEASREPPFRPAHLLTPVKVVLGKLRSTFGGADLFDKPILPGTPMSPGGGRAGPHPNRNKRAREGKAVKTEGQLSNDPFPSSRLHAALRVHASPGLISSVASGACDRDRRVFARTG